jgi:hypothetical protein
MFCIHERNEWKENMTKEPMTSPAWWILGLLACVLCEKPEALHALAAVEKGQREMATRELCGEIWCDCDPFEIDVLLVPGVIEWVQWHDWSDRKAIVRALEALVWGDADEAAGVWSEAALVSWLTKEARRFDPRVFAAGAQVDDPSDFSLAGPATPGLQRIERVWPRLQEIVRRQFVVEPDPYAQTHLLLSLYRPALCLAAGGSPVAGLDERLLLEVIQSVTCHPVVKMAAALLAVRLGVRDGTAWVVPIVLDLVRDQEIIDEWDRLWSRAPQDECLLDHVAWVLRWAPAEMGEMIVPILLELITERERAYEQSHYRSREYGRFVEVAHTLLGCVFGEPLVGGNVLPFGVTKLQRAVLTTLLTSQLIDPQRLSERFDVFHLPNPWKARLLLQLDV